MGFPSLAVNFPEVNPFRRPGEIHQVTQHHAGRSLAPAGLLQRAALAAHVLLWQPCEQPQHGG